MILNIMDWFNNEKRRFFFKKCEWLIWLKRARIGDRIIMKLNKKGEKETWEKWLKGKMNKMEKKYNQIFYMQLPCIDLKGKKKSL